MAAEIKEGDRVQIADRPQTADDVKSSMFYNHFRGLTGIVQKMYTTEAAIEIELDVLPDAVTSRHIDIQEAMKAKWLEGLSEESKNRLTDQERDFRLRYTVLVASSDLVAAGPKPAVPPVSPPATGRATEQDLAAAEEAELKRRQQEKQD